MKVPVAVAQIPVTWDLGKNLKAITAALAAANIADPNQHCPTMIISPRGEVLAEVPHGKAGMVRATIDTDDISDWYLAQRRTDVLRLHYREAPHDS